MGPLPQLDDRSHAAHGSRGLQPHRGAVLGADMGAGRAVIGGPDRGHFEEGRDPDPAVDAGFPQLRLSGPERLVIHHPDQLVEAPAGAEPPDREPARGPERIIVVGPVVAPTQLHGIDAGGIRGPVEKLLGDGAGDGLAHRAVHSRRRLVLERDPQPGVVMRVGVGAGRHHDRHHAFADRRPAERAVGAERGERVHREPPDPAVPVDPQPGADRLVAGMDVADERLHPVDDVLDRPSEDLAHRRDRDLVAVDVELDAEPAADIGRHDADQMFRNPEIARQRVLLVPRRLVAAVHGERALARIVVGDDGAHFERDAAMAGEGEAALDDMRRPVERGFGIPGADRRGKAEIAAELRVDQRCIVVERPVAHRRGGQRLPLDRDLAGRVLGLGAGRGDDGGDRLALPDDAVDRDRVLGRRDHRRQVVHRPLPRLADFGDFGARYHPRAGNRGERRGRVDPEDPRMCVGASDEGEMEQPGEAEVVGIPAPAEREPAGAAAGYGTPDGARGISHRSGSPSSSRPRPRWRDSRCSGSNCRTGTRGSRRASSCAPPPSSRPRSAASPACSSRIAARCG